MGYVNHKIIIRNTCIIVTNYHMGDSPQLERNFQIWDNLTHRFIILGMFVDEVENKLFLPRGIDIGFVKRCVNASDSRTETPNQYQHIQNMKMKFHPRDERQIECLKFVCGIGPDYEENIYQPQLSINMNTGVGKTYCTIAAIAYMKIKAIVITGSNSLLKQWKNNIKEYSNFSERDVLFISGGQMMSMILQNKSNNAKNASIFLCTHATIRSFADTYGWDKINEIFLNLGIGIKVFDEAHQNFENTLLIDFFTNIHKTLYVTATPARSDSRENRIYQMSIKNVPNIDLFDEDNDPHTSYMAIKYNSHPDARTISAIRNAYGLDRNKYVTYITSKPEFYQMMRIIMDLVIRCKGRVLFYIGTNDGILKVYKWIGENYPEFIGDIGVFTSIIGKEQKAQERNKKLILSTTKSAGAGEDIKHLKMTIVLAEPFRSEVLARQTLGRTRDAGTTYIELVDLGFMQLRRFYTSKLPIFNKYALDTSDTTVETYELQRRSERLEILREEKLAKSPISFHDERFFQYDDPSKRKTEIIKPITFYKKKGDIDI